MSHSLSSDSYEIPDVLKKRLQQVLKNENAKAGADKYTFDGKSTVYVTEDPNAAEAEPLSPWYAVLFLGMICTGVLLTLFLTPGSPAQLTPDSDSDSSDEDSDEERVFAISSQNLLAAQRMLTGVDPTVGWTGGSKACYATQNTEFADLLAYIAETNRAVDNTVRTEAEQVNHGRESLGNSLTGLQLAIPVSELLYFSGPTGPAISHSFQLVVANSAVGTGVDTTNAMHEHSAQHAEHLTALTQKYYAVLQTVFAAASPENPAGEFRAPEATNSRERRSLQPRELSSFANRTNAGTLASATQQVVTHPGTANKTTRPRRGTVVTPDDEPQVLPTARQA